MGGRGGERSAKAVRARPLGLTGDPSRSRRGDPGRRRGRRRRGRPHRSGARRGARRAAEERRPRRLRHQRRAAAGQAGRPPAREVAEIIAARLRAADGIARVDVAGPGFLNVTLAADSLGALARTIVEAGAGYGRSTNRAGQRINLEFVSANPTGPVHLGGTRWAAVGDALARILEATGATVTREYYFNDHGAQIDRFARSLLARAQGEPTPEDGYGGSYVDEIADTVVAAEPDVLELPRAEAQEVFRRAGVALMFAEVKQSLHDFGVDFDVYFHENSLHESGAVDKAVQQLKESGHLYLKDGAWWLRTTEFGDDKDRVVIKSDGNPAYIAGDLAYLRDKRERGFDLCIYLLGADHHGYIARLKAAAAAFGDDPDVVEVLIGQMVNLVKDGRPVRMSKRAGTVLTIDDLVDAVGVDAARYSLERSAIETSLDVDLDLLAKHTNDNPVYYVQYAHARTCNVRRNAERFGIGLDVFEPELLDQPGRRRAAHRAGGVPPHRRDRRRAAGAPPHRALPREPRRRLPPLVRHRRVPGHAQGRRRGHRRQPHPVLAQRRHPDRAGQRARPARRQRAGTDVSGPHVSRNAHPAGPRHGDVLPDAHLQAAPTTRTRWTRSIWPASARRVDGVLHLGGAPITALVDEHGTPALFLDEEDLRSRARAYTARCAASTSITRARRSCAPRSRAGSPRRVWGSTSAPAASSPSRWPPASRPTASACTATTSPSPS